MPGPFTQPDPIGLAGGLNLYGYAGGDPINYHDPFGLRSTAQQDDEVVVLTPEAQQAVDECLEIPACRAEYDRLHADANTHYVTTGPMPTACAAAKIIGGCTEALGSGDSRITLNPSQYGSVARRVGVPFTPGLIVGHEFTHAGSCRGNAKPEVCARQGENVMRQQVGFPLRRVYGR